MQLHTFKARSLAEALQLVRDELGPDASVLHTREVGSPLARLLGGQTIEVTASAELAAPRRLRECEVRSGGPIEPPDGGTMSVASACPASSPLRTTIPAAELQDFRRKFRQDLAAVSHAEPSLVEQLASSGAQPRPTGIPGKGAITDRLRRAGVSESTVGRWLQRLEAELACDPECHPDRMLQKLRLIIAAELSERIL